MISFIFRSYLCLEGTTRRDENERQRGLETRLRLEPQLEKYVFFFVFFLFLFFFTVLIILYRSTSNAHYHQLCDDTTMYHDDDDDDDERPPRRVQIAIKSCRPVDLDMVERELSVREIEVDN